MSLDKGTGPDVLDETADNEFSDDPDGPPLIRIPIPRGRAGRASRTQSTTTGNKGRKSSMASPQDGSSGPPDTKAKNKKEAESSGNESMLTQEEGAAGRQASSKLEQQQMSDTGMPLARAPATKTDLVRRPRANTGPARISPARTDPATMDPARTDPATMDPASTDLARTDPLSALGVTPLQLADVDALQKEVSVSTDLPKELAANSKEQPTSEGEARFIKTSDGPSIVMSLDKETGPGVLDEAAENEFSDDPDGPPLIRIPIPRGRTGRASHTQSTTTGNKVRKSSMASPQDGSSGPPDNKANKLEQPQPSDTETTLAGTDTARKEPVRTDLVRTDTAREEPARTDPLSALGVTLASAAISVLFALLVSSYIISRNNNTELHKLIDDLQAEMKLSNAAIERLENDNRMLKSFGRSEKDHSVGTDTETNQDVMYLKSEVEELKLITTGLPQKLQGIASMKRDIDYTRRQVDEEITPMIGRNKVGLEETTELISKTIIPNIDKVKRGVEDATDTISATTKEMHNILKPQIDTLNHDMNVRVGIEKNAEHNIADLRLRTDNTKQGQVELFDLVTKIGNMSERQKEYLRDKIEPNMFNKWATTLAIILIVVLQAGSIVAIYVLCGKGQGHGGQADPEYGPRNTGNRRRNPILNRIQRNRPLQRLVCIISLEPSTRDLHKQITAAVLAGLGVPQPPEVRELLVSSSDDMLRIPAATVNLLFIHFSERHVILEQPGLALGDRHVTTFQAVRQIGGGLAIVYVRDPESRGLKGNDLYNRNIPVAESAELQRLCDDGAFFSTFDKLTQHQTASLQMFIAEYLDKF